MPPVSAEAKPSRHLAHHSLLFNGRHALPQRLISQSHTAEIGKSVLCSYRTHGLGTRLPWGVTWLPLGTMNVSEPHVRNHKPARSPPPTWGWLWPWKRTWTDSEQQKARQSLQMEESQFRNRVPAQLLMNGSACSAWRRQPGWQPSARRGTQLPCAPKVLHPPSCRSCLVGYDPNITKAWEGAGDRPALPSGRCPERTVHLSGPHVRSLLTHSLFRNPRALALLLGKAPTATRFLGVHSE